MKHLTHFQKFNESNTSVSSETELLDSMLKKLSGKSEKIWKLLYPYRETLSKKLSKYYVGGVIRTDLIESDIKNLRFMRQTNEGFFDEDTKIGRVLNFIIGLPGNIIRSLISEIEDLIYDFKKGNYLFAAIKIFITAIVSLLVFAMVYFVVDTVQYAMYGLDQGVVKSEVKYVPASSRHQYVRVGKHTSMVTKHIPEHWTIKVQGIGADSSRTEIWYTYEEDIAEKTQMGDTITNDENWSYDLGSGRQ